MYPARYNISEQLVRMHNILRLPETPLRYRINNAYMHAGRRT